LPSPDFRFPARQFPALRAPTHFPIVRGSTIDGHGWPAGDARNPFLIIELEVVARAPTLLLVQAIDPVDPVPVQASQIPPNLPPEARRSVRVLKLDPLQRNPL